MNKKKLFRRALAYALKKWWLYIPGMLLFVLQDLFFTLFLTFTQKIALDAAVAANTTVIFRTVFGAVVIYGFGLFVINLGAGLFDYTSIYTGNGIQADIFRSAGTLRTDGGEENKGDISAHLLIDCAMTSQLVTYYPGMMLVPSVQFLGCLLVILLLNWQMGLFAVGFALIPILYNRRTNKKVGSLSTQQLSLNGKLLSQFGSNLKAIETIKGFQMENRQSKILRDTLQLMRGNQLKLALYHMVQGSFANLSHALYTMLLLIWGFAMYRNGLMSLSIVLILPTLSSGILKSVESICQLNFDSEQLYHSAERAFGFIDAHQAKDKLVYASLDQRKLIKNKQAIEFENVSYQYENGRGFKNLSLKIPENNFTCIFGTIGSGKSTLVSCILGFKQVQSGRIYSYGQAQSQLTEQEWMRRFSYVPQTATLLNMSIEDNILLGRKIDQERFNFVLKISGLDNLIDSLPKGLKTPVGEHGGQLSGGQLQMVCFARALYSPAPILVLDEFSSAFDDKTDDLALSAIQSITSGADVISKTVVVVSHKQKYIDAADQVLTIPTKKIANEKVVKNEVYVL